MLKKRIITSPAFAWFLARFICLYSWTFRLTVKNEHEWIQHLEGGGRVILCSWHQQFFSFIRHFRGYSPRTPALMISRSADGTLIAGVARNMGWLTVRGSSSRGGPQAMLGMIRHLQEHHLGAHIADGPRGPVGIVKAGVVHMARETNAVIVPVYAEAERAWQFRSWDRFFIPKPFSRVCIRFGSTFSVPSSEGADWLEEQRSRLETIMRPGLAT